jgi:Pectate lyase superfamily protein
MPKSIPAIGESNWGTPLNAHLAQLQNPINGGINTFEQFSQRPTTLTADDIGKTCLYTQTGNLHQWTGTAWKVLNESVINVKDYGAVGDGATDDTEAIQTSVNKGGLINLPSGEYLISTTIAIPSNTKILGASRNFEGGVKSTKITYNKNAGVCFDTEQTQAINIEISNIGIYCSNSRGSSIAINTVYSSFSNINNVFVKGFDIAIRYGKQNNSNYSDIVLNSNNYGIFGVEGATGGDATNVTNFSNIYGSNIANVGCTFHALTANNNVSEIGMDGCNIGFSIANCNLSSFKNLYTELDISVGIFLHNCNNCVVENLYIGVANAAAPVTYIGMHILTCDNTTITNVNVDGNKILPTGVVDGNFSTHFLCDGPSNNHTLDGWSVTATTPNFISNSSFNYIRQSGKHPKLSSVQVLSSGFADNSFVLGNNHLWVDLSGKLRIKNGQPTSDTDGAVVGSQG